MKNVKKIEKTLSLSKETLRRLSSKELAHVAGAGFSNNQQCSATLGGC